MRLGVGRTERRGGCLRTESDRIGCLGEPFNALAAGQDSPRRSRLCLLYVTGRSQTPTLSCLSFFLFFRVGWEEGERFCFFFSFFIIYIYQVLNY